VRGVRVFTASGDSGYGIAGVAYVRALVNAGLPVHWSAFDWPNGSMGAPVLLPTAESLARLTTLSFDAKTDDTIALVRATAKPIACDVALLHSVPEHIAHLRQANMRNVAYTTWEASRIPPHWVPALNSLDAVAVPSSMNRDAFRTSGVRVPVSIVPHIRRSFRHEFDAAERAALFDSLGLDAKRITLLTIGTGLQRKNLQQLVRCFYTAFNADSPVQLLIKTSLDAERGEFPFAAIKSQVLIDEWLRANMQRCGRTTAPIRGICHDRLRTRDIDALHTIADCYVSFTRGEGWGLGAFDAAADGTPVVMPAWGGHRDFLPDPWFGMVPCSMQSAVPWPMSKPSFWPDQQWAVAQDDDCIAALRNIPENIDALRANARRQQAFIADEFSEARVVRALIDVLRGEA
jgi:glycosyltransferase involved in cell wall biosynthesis